MGDFIFKSLKKRYDFLHLGNIILFHVDRIISNNRK